MQEFETDNEAVRRRGKIICEAYAQAVQEAEAINWLKNSTPLKTSPLNLGKKIGAQYACIYKELDNPDDVVRLAQKWLWIAARHNELTQLARKNGRLVDDSNSATATNFTLGYFDGFPFGTDVYYFDDHPRSANKTHDEKGQRCDMLNSIGLILFCEADAMIGSGNVADALDKIAEAFSAITEAIYMMELMNIEFKWEEEERHNAYSKSRSARQSAMQRHAETYELRDKIITYWSENISTDQSNEFAAELLQKEFPEVAHRTLAKYVSEAKKLPPAGTL